MSNDLLHKVEVCKLTDEIVELVRNIIRQELRAQQANVTLIGGLTVQRAADYVGVSKRQFWNLLKDEPELDASSFSIGVRRYWRKDVLDAWMASRPTRTIPSRTAPRRQPDQLAEQVRVPERAVPQDSDGLLARCRPQAMNADRTTGT